MHASIYYRNYAYYSNKLSGVGRLFEINNYEIDDIDRIFLKCGESIH